jgi:hypothetical protein
VLASIAPTLLASWLQAGTRHRRKQDLHELADGNRRRCAPGFRRSRQARVSRERLERFLEQE